MRTAIGIIIGLVIGVPLGLFGMNYWHERSSITIPKANKETQATPKETQVTTQPDKFYSCQLKDSSRQSALIIKSDNSGAKKIIFPWKNDDGDEFRIMEATDLFYIAVDVDPKPSSHDTALELNRVTGDLYLTNMFKAEVVNLCEKRLPPEQCGPGMERLGGHPLDCFGAVTESACQKWTTGSRFSFQSRFVCKAAERVFFDLSPAILCHARSCDGLA